MLDSGGVIVALFLICEYDLWPTLARQLAPCNFQCFHTSKWWVILKNKEVLAAHWSFKEADTVLLMFTFRNCFVCKSFSFFWLASSNSHSFENSEYYYSCVDFFSLRIILVYFHWTMKYMENVFFRICQNICLREDSELPRRELSCVSWRGNRKSFITILYLFITSFCFFPRPSTHSFI